MPAAIAICAHPDRFDHIESMVADLNAVVALDTLGPACQLKKTHRSNLNHDRAWELAYARAQEIGADWCVVLEDDAVPAPGFLDLLDDTLARAHEGSIVSLYFGRGRVMQHKAVGAVRRANVEEAGWIRHNTLCWGVGVAIRTVDVPAMLKFVQSVNRPYDDRLGWWAYNAGFAVDYCWPSLVDHQDEPSLIHSGPIPVRKAWAVGVPNRSDHVVCLLGDE